MAVVLTRRLPAGSTALPIIPPAHFSGASLSVESGGAHEREAQGILALRGKKHTVQPPNRLDPTDKKSAEALRYFNGLGFTVGTAHSLEHGFDSSAVADALVGSGGGGAWPTAAAPTALVEQWGAGGGAATDFVAPRAPAFAAAPRAADIPGRRSAEDARAARRGASGGAPRADLVRLPTGALIAPAASPLHGRRRPASGGAPRAALAALVDHLHFTDVGIVGDGGCGGGSGAPRAGRGSGALALAARASAGAAAGLRLDGGAGEGAGAAPPPAPAPPAPPSGGAAPSGARFYGRELVGAEARALLSAPPPARVAHAARAADEVAPEAAARFTTQSRATHTGAAEGGPARAPPRRRALAPMPPEIVASAANAGRSTMIY